jgi:hypothetical protein
MARNLVEAEAILQGAGYRRPTADRRPPRPNAERQMMMGDRG